MTAVTYLACWCSRSSYYRRIPTFEEGVSEGGKLDVDLAVIRPSAGDQTCLPAACRSDDARLQMI